MKKEVILAIVAGVVAGLLLAFGVWRLTLTLKKDESPNSTTRIESSPTSKTDFSVVISKPSDMSVVTDELISISGLTKHDSIVVISTDEKDYQVKTQNDGSFESEVKFLGGLNVINITSFDKQGTSTQTKLNIAYSSKFEKYLNKSSEPETGESTDSANSIREKVQQKLDATLNSPVFYMGSITDITDSTVQLKSEDNGIQQISLSDETSYVSDEDLAIGDFIVAMGFVNGNKVLDTKRILALDPEEENKISAFWVTLTDITGKKVSYKNPSSEEEYEITFPKTWVGPDIDELEEGENYIVTGSLEDQKLDLRSIFEL